MSYIGIIVFHRRLKALLVKTNLLILEYLPASIGYDFKSKKYSLVSIEWINRAKIKTIFKIRLEIINILYFRATYIKTDKIIKSTFRYTLNSVEIISTLAKQSTA
jgi:hypothetical protein